MLSVILHGTQIHHWRIKRRVPMFLVLQLLGVIDLVDHAFYLPGVFSRVERVIRLQGHRPWTVLIQINLLLLLLLSGSFRLRMQPLNRTSLVQPQVRLFIEFVHHWQSKFGFYLPVKLALHLVKESVPTGQLLVRWLPLRGMATSEGPGLPAPVRPDIRLRVRPSYLLALIAALPEVRYLEGQILVIICRGEPSEEGR